MLLFVSNFETILHKPKENQRRAKRRDSSAGHKKFSLHFAQVEESLSEVHNRKFAAGIENEGKNNRYGDSESMIRSRDLRFSFTDVLDFASTDFKISLEQKSTFSPQQKINIYFLHNVSILDPALISRQDSSSEFFIKKPMEKK